jgi:carboxypeptidase Q
LCSGDVAHRITRFWVRDTAAIKRENQMKARGVSFFSALAICAMASSWAVIRAQQPAAAAKDPNAESDDKILAEVHDHNQILFNLEYVSDMIGARLTGSENLKKANDWTRQKFADYGVANPHLESWTIAHTWGRGAASGRIISPSLHPLAIASYAWAPSTNGAVRGPVVYVKAQSVDDFAQYKGKLKGAIVISAEPALLPPPDQPAPNPVNIPYGDSMVLVAPHRPGAQITPGPGYREFIQARSEFFKIEGVLATLTDSGKPDGLLNMTGLGGRKYDIAPIPAAFVSSASYGMIWRLLQRGPVEVELNLTNSIGDKPVEVYNTVAEIRGSEKPDESCCSARIWIPGILAQGPRTTAPAR